MILINCEINLILTWSANCIIVSADISNQDATFLMIETEFCAVVVTLSTQDNAKLLQKLKPCLKGTVNWNWYTSKPKFLRQNGNDV